MVLVVGWFVGCWLFVWVVVGLLGFVDLVCFLLGGVVVIVVVFCMLFLFSIRFALVFLVLLIVGFC